MIFLNCDYNEGCHPKILERLVETNFDQCLGYGDDKYSKHARELIKKSLGTDDCDIYFLVSGTPTNVAALNQILKPYQAVMAPDTAHINVHETGMPEACGHKILTFPNQNGKITIEQIDEFMRQRNFEAVVEHSVEPKLVYITYPTEIGTLYTKKELEDLHAYCKKNDLYLYLDGARLGYGLTAEDGDITFEDIAKNCDMFYIGGTKCGALLGEAMVIMNDELKKGFRYVIKQTGQLLAKGRAAGIQFETLFTDNLYIDICANANAQACRVRDKLKEKGIEFLYETSTNQQFPIVPNSFLEATKDEYVFDKTKIISDDLSAIRICTSWATKDENIDKLIEIIDKNL